MLRRRKEHLQCRISSMGEGIACTGIWDCLLLHLRMGGVRHQRSSWLREAQQSHRTQVWPRRAVLRFQQRSPKSCSPSSTSYALAMQLTVLRGTPVPGWTCRRRSTGYTGLVCAVAPDEHMVHGSSSSKLEPLMACKQISAPVRLTCKFRGIRMITPNK